MFIPDWLTNEHVLGYLNTAWSVIKVLIFFVVVRYVSYTLIDRVLATITNRDTGSSGRMHTLGSLLKSIIFYVLIFVSGVMVLRVFNLDPTPVLTAAGVVGLAVGFGAQKLVRDIIAGFFTVLENQYAVGEYVTIGTVTGTVVELGMRVTRLRDDAGKLVIIANGDIAQVVNHSRGPIQAIIEVSVTPDSDLAKVREIIDGAGRKLADEMEGVVSAPKADGLIAANAEKLTLQVSGDVLPGRTFAVQTRLRELVRERLMAEGISFV